MIKTLIICYIIILILQFIITKYSAPNLPDSKISLQKRVNYNKEHKDELLKNFGEKILEIVKPLNSGEMNFDEWNTWLDKIPPFESGGHEYYITVWEMLEENGVEDFVLLHYGDPNYIGLNYEDFRKEIQEIAVNSKNVITADSSRYASETGGIGNLDGFTYYWIDPLSLQSVKKESVNTLFRDKTGKHGYISVGIDLEDLSDTYAFKYYERIRPITLFITSIMTISVSIIIYNLNAMKYSNVRAFLFLFISNIYLLIFANTYENESTPENEYLKLERITSAILTFSFLSGVNIYILKSLFDEKKTYFKESAFMFGVSIILILMSAYKYENPNDIKGLLTQRISSQLTFNLAVILNSLILISFMFYTLSIRQVIKL
jgi:hypothetical protein